MARYKTTAEQNFDVRFRQALEWRDWALVEKSLVQYGYYLELIDPEAGEGDAQHTLVEFVPVKPDYSRLPEWEMPAFERKSDVTKWIVELEWDFNEQRRLAYAPVVPYNNLAERAKNTGE
jgi:hypothetical protein